jgi:mannose-6-phosphate isomerase-like protein (cupin superfamily)
VTVLLDLTAELAKLTMFRERTPTSTREERKGSSTGVTAYRDATVFVSKSAGKGAWERHPDGDELVYVVDGEATLQVGGASGTQSLHVDAGKLAIVRQGDWHRFHYPNGVTLMTITPGKSEYVRADVDDPLSIEPVRD